MKEKIRVLIVDDDKVFCQLLNKGLGRLGYQPETAHTGAQALAITNKPDVILLDMRLGEESGLGLVPDLLEKFPDAKIVIVTGYANLATAVAAVKKGASNYIAKPVNVKDIHCIIQECLSNSAEDADTATIPGQSPSLKRLEWEHIHRVLEENDGNISRTAKKLGMHRRTLQRKLKKHAP
jgi:two-component system response regulator RegA